MNRLIKFIKDLDRIKPIESGHLLLGIFHTDEDGDYSAWSYEELTLLFQIAMNNSQVKYIIKDKDVRLFYSRLLASAKRLTEDMKAVKEILENEE